MRVLSSLAVACTLAGAAGCTSWEPVKASFPHAATGADAPASAEGDARVTVHLEPDRAPHLDVLDASGRWIPACDAPCDRALPRTATYRVRAEGQDDEPAPFTLANVPGSRVALRQTGGGTAQTIGGVTLAVVAVPLALYGALGVACSQGCTGDSGPHGGGPSQPPFSPSFGPTLLALSGLSLGLGIWLLATSHPPRLEQQASADPVNAARKPSFRDPSAVEKAYAKPTVVPIFSGTF